MHRFTYHVTIATRIFGDEAHPGDILTIQPSDQSNVCKQTEAVKAEVSHLTASA